jgi:hypothetical protein
MVDVRTIRGGMIRRDEMDHWRTVLRGTRALAIWFPTVFANLANQVATFKTAEGAAYQFALLLDTLFELRYDFREYVDNEETVFEEEIETEAEVPHAEWREEGLHITDPEAADDIDARQRRLYYLESWFDNPPFDVFGWPRAFWDVHHGFHGFAAACWMPFRGDVMYFRGDDISQAKGLSEPYLSMLLEMPRVGTVPLETLRRELNRRPVLRVDNFGDLLLFMLAQTDNIYADLSYVELDGGGGWQDVINWEDEEAIRFGLAKQEQARAWHDETIELARLVDKDPDLMIDIMMHIYGAVAVVRAREQLGPHTLMEVLLENDIVA